MDAPALVVVEAFKTRWRTISNIRLRLCVDCRSRFPSAGKEERFCEKCSKSIAEARARPFIDKGEDFKRELEESFDLEQANRVKENEKWRDAQRIKRQLACSKELYDQPVPC